MTWIETFLTGKTDRGAWAAALSALGPLGLPETIGSTLAGACQTPAQLQRIAGLLAARTDDPGAPSARAGSLLRAVDESIASLPEWIAGLEVLLDHLARQHRETSLEMASGFLGCCCEAMASGAAYTDLARVVREMLDTHGFQG